MMVQAVEFILYVSDLWKSKSFYASLLDLDPILDVEGMVEFSLGSGVKLGLMPENGIARILGDNLPHPNKATGIPRCELYLKVDDAQVYLNRGVKAGAKMIDELKCRDWGDNVGYIADEDGNVIALAE